MITETYHGHTIQIAEDGVLKIDGIEKDYTGDPLRAAYNIIEKMDGAGLYV